MSAPTIPSQRVTVRRRRALSENASTLNSDFFCEFGRAWDRAGLGSRDRGLYRNDANEGGSRGQRSEEAPTAGVDDAPDPSSAARLVRPASPHLRGVRAGERGRAVITSGIYEIMDSRTTVKAVRAVIYMKSGTLASCQSAWPAAPLDGTCSSMGRDGYYARGAQLHAARSGGIAARRPFYGHRDGLRTMHGSADTAGGDCGNRIRAAGLGGGGGFGGGGGVGVDSTSRG